MKYSIGVALTVVRQAICGIIEPFRECRFVYGVGRMLKSNQAPFSSVLQTMVLRKHWVDIILLRPCSSFVSGTSSPDGGSPVLQARGTGRATTFIFTSTRPKYHSFSG